MPIDTSILRGIQPVQVENPLNRMAQVLQIQSAQQDMGLRSMQADELRRGIDRKNRLYSTLDAEYAKPEDREGALLRAGFVDEAVKLGKDRREGVKLENESTKAAADAAKTQLEMGLKKAEHAASLFSLAKDPQSYGVVRALVKQQLGQDLPEQYDPNFVQAQVAMGMTITQKLAAEHQRLTLAETQRHNVTAEGLTARGQDMTATTARRGQDITMRGQNMVDSRAREANNAGKVPAGYRMTAEGNLEFIPGGPADPNTAKRAAPTEFQGKAGMFGNRAAEADRIITQLEGQYSPTGINTKQALGRTPVIGGALEAGTNLALSDASQKAEQAQRDFVNAVLRLESGAAIAQSEFDNAKKQYFPQPGDSPAVIAQKAQNRKTAIQGLMNNARPGMVQATAQAPSGGATGDFGNDPLGIRGGR